jgi:hypothetical protein
MGDISKGVAMKHTLAPKKYAKKYLNTFAPKNSRLSVTAAGDTIYVNYKHFKSYSWVKNKCRESTFAKMLALYARMGEERTEYRIVYFFGSHETSPII